MRAIGESAFAELGELRVVTVPDSVSEIGEKAFNYCTKLYSVTLGSGVKKIGEQAFGGCYGLMEVINHSSLDIAKGGTQGDNYGGLAGSKVDVRTTASGLDFSGNTVFYRAKNGTNYLLEYNGDRVVLSESYRGESYVIYDGVFANREDIVSLKIPDKVTVIGGSSFEECTNLKSVAFGRGLKEIDDFAFSDCTALTEITLPEGLTRLGDDVFNECTSLKTVVIPDSIEELGEGVFDGCKSLEKIKLPRGLVCLGIRFLSSHLQSSVRVLCLLSQFPHAQSFPQTA
ncbi:MAG: leucine-rich repeat domain-containing protein, partial [Clostridia bacterium]|nr:leucine-rich repeat domain-containing protein [Clostridia bacterium]